jgi:hypothetical protein
MTQKDKKDIKPLVDQLIGCNSIQTELETVRIWFLEFLESIDGISNIDFKLNKSQGNIAAVYSFSFQYDGVKFYAQTLPPCRISIQTLGLIHYLNANGDYLSNLLALASAIARELRIHRYNG